jgi:hypothetical protein
MAVPQFIKFLLGSDWFPDQETDPGRDQKRLERKGGRGGVEWEEKRSEWRRRPGLENKRLKIVVFLFCGEAEGPAS